MGIKNAFTPNNMQLDAEIETFIKKCINSFVKWDLLVFFHYNPTVSDNPKNIATRIGRNEEEVREALEELKNENILDLKDETTQTYSFSPAEKNRVMIEKFIELLKDRQARLQMVSLVLNSLRKGS